MCGFEATIDGRRVVGHVEEREKAFSPVRRGDGGRATGPICWTRSRPDIFTVSVGNVPPGKEVVLRITTVSELALEGDAIRFTLPTTISPRYAPAEDLQGVGIPEVERVTPPYALAVPYGLSLKVDVETSARDPHGRVAQPSRPGLDRGPSRRGRALRAGDGHGSRLRPATSRWPRTNQPRVLAERGPDGKTYLLVSFRPKLEAGAAASEVLFLVDRSGSMDGASIVEARNALQLALRTLRPGCFFNIVGFGSSHSALFPESRPYDDEHRWRPLPPTSSRWRRTWAGPRSSPPWSSCSAPRRRKGCRARSSS